MFRADNDDFLEHVGSVVSDHDSANISKGNSVPSSGVLNCEHAPVCVNDIASDVEGDGHDEFGHDLAGTFARAGAAERVFEDATANAAPNSATCKGTLWMQIWSPIRKQSPQAMERVAEAETELCFF